MKDRLTPESLRSTFAFAGLFQLTHEMLKQVILENVRQFYSRGWDDDGRPIYDKSYEVEVRNRVTKPGRKANAFEGSVAWLVSNNAITEEQGRTLDEIYEHRHALTHDLARFIVDIDRDIDADFFSMR
ncbi:hypothetical protein [Rhodococcus sp. D-46]|uniref:hypothetical protein n=1 Tax=Rhodococcus sp. D-46 TaxID=2716265 RepID=UPI001A98ECF7